MITEDYCSYEVSELLKQKACDEIMFSSYQPKHNKDGTSIIYSTCSHQMAMKWLREVYDLHIVAYPYKRGKDGKGWCCQVYKTYNLLGQERYIDETLNSYEEAVDAALKYSLENLI